MRNIRRPITLAVRGVRKALKIAISLMSFFIFLFIGLFILLRPAGILFSLPSVTTASLWHAGDPINVAFIGDRNSITRAFLGAGWLVPDPTTAKTTARIIETSIANASYPSAPVSKLHLFGRAQDLAFELPTDTVRKRHHVRMWTTGTTISGRPLWIGSASYDAGLELSAVTAMPTHHISPNVDSERGLVVASLKRAGVGLDVTMERNNYPTLWGFNGGGDWYFDDGQVAVVTLR